MKRNRPVSSPCIFYPSFCTVMDFCSPIEQGNAGQCEEEVAWEDIPGEATIEGNNKGFSL